MGEAAAIRRRELEPAIAAAPAPSACSFLVVDQRLVVPVSKLQRPPATHVEVFELAPGAVSTARLRARARE